MKLKVFLFICVLIQGCASVDSTLPSVEFGLVGNKFPDTKFGTYTQWNEKYAVTAAHVGKQHNTAYQSKELDVQFVKIPSSIKPTLYSVSGYGVDYGLYYNRSRNYALIDSGIQKGMSGGPVYNSKKEIVGISIGYTQGIPTANGNSIHSIVLPYSEIKKEWDKFMKKQTPEF